MKIERALEIIQKQAECANIRHYNGCPGKTRRNCEKCRLNISHAEINEAAETAEEVFEFTIHVADIIAEIMAAHGISSVEEWKEKFGGGETS